MSITKTLITATNILEQLKIPYMISGSVAVNFYGISRLTHDVDLIVELSPVKIKPLVKSLQNEFYASTEAATEALMHQTMFNAIHHETNLKVDFWIIKRDAYDILRFNRRQKHKLKNQLLNFISPEDLIIVKLSWYKKTNFPKHFEDTVGVIAVQGEKLDSAYLNKWTKEKSVWQTLQKAKNWAGKIRL